MRLDISKLTKTQVNEIVKSLPPKFSGIVTYGISKANRNVKSDDEIDKMAIELYNRNTDEVFDKWGEYNIAKNRIFVMAWDNACKWQVGVYLYQDHYEIPEYNNGMYANEIKNSFSSYSQKIEHMIRMNSNISFKI